MTYHRDVWTKADALIDNAGPLAPHIAVQQMYALQAQGDSEGMSTWADVLCAVTQLMLTPRYLH